MKKIIITTLIATAFISLLLSANVMPKERKQQPASITTTTPKNGTIEGDLIWRQGFGWIEMRVMEA